MRNIIAIVERELRTLPVAVDDRRDLGVHESTDAGLQRTLLVSE